MLCRPNSLWILAWVFGCISFSSAFVTCWKISSELHLTLFEKIFISIFHTLIMSYHNVLIGRFCIQFSDVYLWGAIAQHAFQLIHAVHLIFRIWLVFSLVFFILSNQTPTESQDWVLWFCICNIIDKMDLMCLFSGWESFNFFLLWDLSRWTF